MSRIDQIAEMLGYNDLNHLHKALENGKIALVRIPEDSRVSTANWCREQASQVAMEGSSRAVEIAAGLNAIAAFLEFAQELQRFPADADLCGIGLPADWPNYCDKDRLD